MRRVFTGLFSLEDDGVVESALKAPERYVLKPQREGGGNNLYGHDLKQALERMTKEERNSFILMERICPKAFGNYIVRNNHAAFAECSSELGTFAAFLGDDSGNVKLNCFLGHLLRSKVATVEDGGVAAGVAVLDSPFLV